MRLLLEIVRQPAMAPYCATPFTVPADETEDALREHIARHTTTLYHPVGTCAMGGVVDAELRVNGVEGLRVVDASVMPMVPRGNTNAPTIAVAERAADLIRGRVGEQAAEVAAPGIELTPCRTIRRRLGHRRLGLRGQRFRAAPGRARLRRGAAGVRAPLRGRRVRLLDVGRAALLVGCRSSA